MTELPITLIDDGNDAVRILWLSDYSNNEVKGKDYFECLIQLRSIFNHKDSEILCNGCRYDVYPSRMSRQMSKGLKAYVLTLGKQAKQNDIVDIFGKAEREKIGTVQQQREYYTNWLNSLG